MTDQIYKPMSLEESGLRRNISAMVSQLSELLNVEPRNTWSQLKKFDNTSNPDCNFDQLQARHVWLRKKLDNHICNTSVSEMANSISNMSKDSIDELIRCLQSRWAQ